MEQELVKELQKPNEWRRRRRWMSMALFVLIGIVALYIARIFITGGEHAGLLSLAQTALVSATGIVGTYVFGAVWDDRNTKYSMSQYGAQRYGSQPHKSPLSSGTWRT